MKAEWTAASDKTEDCEKNIFLIRHGDNERNLEDPDVALSENGVAEAQDIGDYIAGVKPALPVVIITSNLRRGIQTGEIIKEKLLEKTGDRVCTLKAGFIAEDDAFDSVLKAIHIMPGFDTPKEVVEGWPSSKVGDGPVGTCIWIGHKQNMFLDLMGLLLNLRAGIQELSSRDLKPEDIDFDYLCKILEEPGALEQLMGQDDDGDMELYGTARLTRWRLLTPEWRDFNAEGYAEKIEDRRFSRTGSRLMLSQLSL